MRGDYGLHVVVTAALRREPEAQEFMRRIICYRGRISKTEYYYALGFEYRFGGAVELPRIEDGFGVQ